MKKYSEDGFFFEITSGPRTSDGQHIRYYLIRCCRCDRTASYHASGISNERMKKLFNRQGWKVGKSRNLHICPECQRKREHHIAEHGDDSIIAREVLELPPPEPPPLPALEKGWQDANYLDRAEFCERHKAEIERYLKIKEQHRREDAEREGWQFGPHIDSMPQEENEPAPAATQLTPSHEAPSPEEEDEPADWWKELMEQK